MIQITHRITFKMSVSVFMEINMEIQRTLQKLPEVKSQCVSVFGETFHALPKPGLNLCYFCT